MLPAAFMQITCGLRLVTRDLSVGSAKRSDETASYCLFGEGSVNRESGNGSSTRGIPSVLGTVMVHSFM